VDYYNFPNPEGMRHNQAQELRGQTIDVLRDVHSAIKALDRSTVRLERLTWALCGLTIILVISAVLPLFHRDRTQAPAPLPSPAAIHQPHRTA
jgi:hypothetical protein